MNLQSIWSGEQYAFASFKPNKTFVLDARRGRVVKTYKASDPFKQRQTAYVEFEELDKETGKTLHNNGTVKVRARDVIDFWDSYTNERNALYAEQMEKQRIAREQREALERERQIREQERREREEAERAEAERKRTEFISTFIAQTGIPAEIVESVGTHAVTLNRQSLEIWLTANDPH